jgi:hypothetical protein
LKKSLGGKVIQTALPGSQIPYMQRGMMERWNTGRMGSDAHYSNILNISDLPNIPSLHHSNIPGDFNNAGVIGRR